MGSKRLLKISKKLDQNNNLIDYVLTFKSKYFENKNIYILTSEANNNKSLIRYIKKNYKINIILDLKKMFF